MDFAAFYDPLSKDAGIYITGTGWKPLPGSVDLGEYTSSEAAWSAVYAYLAAKDKTPSLSH